MTSRVVLGAPPAPPVVEPPFPILLSDNETNVERNNADGLNNGELVDTRYPLRDRKPIYRYGQNIYS